MRGYGCELDPVVCDGDNWPALELYGSSDVPETANLTGYLDGVIVDQGSTSSCVAHALARAIQIRLRATVDPQAERPCARAMWTQGLGFSGQGTPAQGYPDSGTSIDAGVLAVQLHGYARESVWPWVASPPEPMPWDVATSEFDQVGLKAHRILDGGEIRRATLRAAIASQCPAVIGVDVDGSLDRVHDWTPWEGATQREGGHALCVVGYDPEGVWVVNSWGPDFGVRGLCRIAWPYVMGPRCRSAWVIDAAVAYRGAQ